MKTLLKIAAAVLAFAILVSVVGLFSMFSPMIKAASSVECLEDGLYYMEFKGDDGFSDFISSGGASSSAELIPSVVSFMSHGFADSGVPISVPQDFGCSTISAKDPEGNVLMARNFDFQPGPCVVCHVLPKKGYEYYSTFNIDFLGFGEGWAPDSFKHKYMLLATLFGALDGINEKGLAIADLTAGDTSETHQISDKPDVTTSIALKYMLESAADIDEAIALLETVNMHSDIGLAHHYSMTDDSGRSVVVEYVDDRIVVTETKVVTNHYLCPEKFEFGKYPEDKRQEILEDAYASNSGVLDKETIFDAAKSVWQYGKGPEDYGNTCWTEIFDVTGRKMTLWYARNESAPHTFSFNGM